MKEKVILKMKYKNNIKIWIKDIKILKTVKL